MSKKGLQWQMPHNLDAEIVTHMLSALVTKEQMRAING
jgi:hypothetical protein